MPLEVHAPDVNWDSCDVTEACMAARSLCMIYKFASWPMHWCNASQRVQAMAGGDYTNLSIF